MEPYAKTTTTDADRHILCRYHRPDGRWCAASKLERFVQLGFRPTNQPSDLILKPRFLELATYAITTRLPTGSSRVLGIGYISP